MAKAQQGNGAQGENVIVQLLSTLLGVALRNNASDIHLEPEGDVLRVRLRIDGILREVETHPRSLLDPLVSRVKVLADMDIAEQRKPQDGRFGSSINGRDVDIRVSTFPTIHGENLVLRLLDKQSVLLGLENLGMDKEILTTYQRIITKPYGILFVTGPNGSGKTTTLYATLNTINTVEKNIITLEDPVEYELPLIRQTQIDPDAGLTFASGLRSLLRQDPDIILVGEIRDVDTAEIAVRAALTGHLVLTTLHTSDAVGALARLFDMGVPSVLLTSSLIGVIAQRLVRKLCTTCKQPYAPPAELIIELGLPAAETTTLFKAVGCAACAQTGYLGRTGIFEFLVLDDELRAMMLSRAPFRDIAKAATKVGMMTLREDGVRKALAGMTTVEEVLRVTSADEMPMPVR